MKINFDLERIRMVLASIRERVLFEEFYQQRNQDFKIIGTTDPVSFSKWDVAIESGGTNFIVEVKVRDKVMTWDDWILEENKFSALTAMTATVKGLKNKVETLYLNIFRDGAIIWEVNNTKNFVFFNRDSKCSTIEDRGRKDKSCTYLKNANGTVYTYYNNIQLANEKAKTIFKFLYPGIQIPKDIFKTQHNTK